MRSPVYLDSVADYVRDTLQQIAHLPVSSFSHRSQATLPGLNVVALDSDGAFAGAVERNLISSNPQLVSSVQMMRIFIAHPSIPGVPRPVKWANAPYEPHRVSERLADFGLCASYYYDLDYWQMYDISSGVALQLMAGPDAYPHWEISAPLRPFLHWHYAERGMRLGHAGTLGIDGRGVLLAGAGGSGKSGTVIAGILHGLQSVGDDYVLLSSNSDVVARPIYSTLKQDSEGFRRLGLDDVLSGTRELNWQGKYEFSLQELSRGPIPSELQIGALLVPYVGDSAATTIKEISRGEAMISLAASSIYQMPGERESGFRFFSEIARSLPCFRLNLGRDSREIAETVSRFIQSLSR